MFTQRQNHLIRELKKLGLLGDLHPDQHSIGEERFYLLGISDRGKLLVVCHTDRGENTRIIRRGERTRASEGNMMKSGKGSRKASPVPDIDFSGGVRGKYAARYARGTNLVALSPDVAEVFPDSTAVNEALRTLVRLSGRTVRTSRPARRRAG